MTNDDSHSNLAPKRQVRRGVIGILSRGPTFLTIRRAPELPKGGCWCFPGGHVEPGETSRQAVQRELFEELGIDVAPTERLGAVRVADGRYVLAVWRVRHCSGRLRATPKEISNVRWLTPAEIRAIKPGLPSNERVLEMLGE